MQKLYLMCGYSFSGKSYLATLISTKISAEIISLDKINEERGFDNNSEIPVSEWENTHRIALERLVKYLSEGKSVIIDDTNPLLKLRERFRKVANTTGIKTTVIFLDIPREEIDRRIEENNINLQRHIAPFQARENLINMFEFPDPKIEEVLVYKGEDAISWVEKNIL